MRHLSHMQVFLYIFLGAGGRSIRPHSGELKMANAACLRSVLALRFDEIFIVKFLFLSTKKKNHKNKIKKSFGTENRFFLFGVCEPRFDCNYCNDVSNEDVKPRSKDVMGSFVFCSFVFKNQSKARQSLQRRSHKVLHILF